MTVSTAAPAVDDAEELSDGARQALRDLILTLADCKRVLGIRYSDWMLGAPTLESGIAASSMAQDEWGHGRLTYALLPAFGDDATVLEHERNGTDYHSFGALDHPLSSWTEMIAAALLLDTALSVQYAALLNSSYSPVRNRVQKLLDEESFHFRYATSWTRRLAASREVRSDLRRALTERLPEALRWFGPQDSGLPQHLVAESVVSESPDVLRSLLLGRLEPVLRETELIDAVGLEEQDGAWVYSGELIWSGWDGKMRRARGSGGPDADALARIRGDKNRAFLLE